MMYIYSYHVFCRWNEMHRLVYSLRILRKLRLWIRAVKDLFDGFEDVVVLNASYNAPCCPQRQTGTTLTDLSRMSEKEVVYQQAQDHAPACSISTTLAGLPSPTIVLFPIKIGNLDQPAKSIHSDNIY